MKLKNTILATSIALLPFAASAATFVIPAAGTGAGANNSQWQSELTLHNTSSRAITTTIVYHQGDSASAPVAVTLAPRQTKSIADVVRTTFGLQSGSGALTIEVPDSDANRIAIGSRTFNASAEGEFGQDIPATNVTEASSAGDIIYLAAPSSAAKYRYNFGVYAITATTVQWQLVRADGTVAATKDVTYKAGEQQQYNNGIVTLLGSTAADNDSLHAVVSAGKAIFYGSSINNQTGDPTFVPSVRTREEIRINFNGVDLDENGSIELTDANRDGVLDAPVEVITSLYPSFFKLVATGEFGEAVTYELVSSDGSAVVFPDGTVQLAAAGDLKESMGELRVRATANGSSTILVIPIKFR
ncbi:MAG TPA: hypothetical protein VFN10_17240 [Thermoanaerobaculia bacterium]|nr:hypothetical protein [Thermoanaerobaculia bacterium]